MSSKNSSKVSEIDTSENDPEQHGDSYLRWSGDGPAPAYWYVTDPVTKQPVKVYRSYADYCLD